MKSVLVSLIVFCAIVGAIHAQWGSIDIGNDFQSQRTKTDKYLNPLTKTLALKDTYSSLSAVVQIIDNQVAILKQAISDLEAAVQQAKEAKEAAQVTLNTATANEATARQNRDKAQTQFDQKTAEVAAATAVLNQAEAELTTANENASNAQADYNRKVGAYKTAQNIYDVESVFKQAEIVEFKKILTLFGGQNQS